MGRADKSPTRGWRIGIEQAATFQCQLPMACLATHHAFLGILTVAVKDSSFTRNPILVDMSTRFGSELQNIMGHFLKTMVQANRYDGRLLR